MITFIKKHPLGVGVSAVVVVAGLAWLAFGFFGVHTLFIDDVVQESAPVFDATPSEPETPEPASDQPAEETSDTPPDDQTEEPAEEPAPEPEPATDPADDPAAVASPEIVTEYIGTFRSDAHPTSGTATVLGNGTGQRFLRFENFESDNGPDLNVYLVNSSTGDVSDYIDLGDLKGNIGDQNYEIPEGVDLDVYDEVVIWCVRFSVGFGDALLMPA